MKCKRCKSNMGTSYIESDDDISCRSNEESEIMNAFTESEEEVEMSDVSQYKKKKTKQNKTKHSKP